MFLACCLSRNSYNLQSTSGPISYGAVQPEKIGKVNPLYKVLRFLRSEA